MSEAEPMKGDELLEQTIVDVVTWELYEYIYRGVVREATSSIAATNRSHRKIRDCAEEIMRRWKSDRGT
jgi:hypothetical protein